MAIPRRAHVPKNRGVLADAPALILLADGLALARRDQSAQYMS